MLNRRILRIKAFKVLYANILAGNSSLAQAESQLDQSCEATRDLYLYMLSVVPPLTQIAKDRIEAAKTKLRPTEEDLNPNTRFIDNAFIAQLAQNKQLEEYSNNQKRTWEDEGEFIKRLFASIEESKAYQEYMSKDTLTYEDDRELWRKLYRSMIAQNEQIDEILEEQSLYWNDDKAIVDTFVLKTIKRFEPENGADQELLPEYRDEMDTEFARKLFRNAIAGAEPYRKMIAENTKNWDVERIAFMDILIMQVALAEMFSFPSIPVSVTLNEYVEIAKMYSTPKSGSFINGMLDTIANKLKSEGKLNKA